MFARLPAKSARLTLLLIERPGPIAIGGVITMRLGFFTACLPQLDLEEVAGWAAAAGFDTLEIGAWPLEETGDGASCHLNVRRFGPEQASAARAVLDRHGLTASAVSYYANNLHGDPQRRARIHQHLRACIDAAALLGVPHVGTFIGRDPGRT